MGSQGRKVKKANSCAGDSSTITKSGASRPTPPIPESYQIRALVPAMLAATQRVMKLKAAETGVVLKWIVSFFVEQSSRRQEWHLSFRGWPVSATVSRYFERLPIQSVAQRLLGSGVQQFASQPHVTSGRISAPPQASCHDALYTGRAT